MTARDLIRRMPQSWLSRTLPSVVSDAIDLDDEWEYRRWIELLKELRSGLVPHYIAYGMSSKNDDVREAAADYNKP
jgi:hypothetical protein